ncbi:hypothetical protein EA462_15595 [Natrarchaeobius halalkaliphilus]|uniref:Uncharacterized protein n=2 Tax=Natrarchaeobius halalkaliphilus TaxID=1679091 RepID=A0A3N6LIR0_9EURY|nr:hypothetical protein EA462_15595 [Natrarchaeobius halalkaliphilus]
MSVIQATDTQLPSDYLLLLSASLIALGLALFIVFHAYRGYQRNSSVRMLYLACGLGLITVVPMTLSIGVNSLGQMVDLAPRVYTFYLPLATRVSEITGICTLLYSLLIKPSKSK